MILEGLVTTLDANGRLNAAPMGPTVEPGMTTVLLRPFRTSQTYRNLKERPWGVLHVVDDVLLLAKGAIGRLDAAALPTFPAVTLPAGRVVASACRWHEFEVEALDDSQERTRIVARVTHSGRIRDFFGFNRAKHAVIEAAILATRLHLLPRDDVLRQLAELKVLVEKTAGPAEREAFALLEEFVNADGASGAARRSLPARRGVRVATGARLHFGPLAVGAARGRRFGGLGMMIDAPGFTISLAARGEPGDDELRGDPAWRDRGLELLSRLRTEAAFAASLPGVRAEVSAVVPPHAGLGSGTQFALALGDALLSLAGHDAARAPLAALVGRGVRSSVGTHGYFQGGLIVDGGKSDAESLGACAARVVVPESWRVVVIVPRDGAGLSGAEERRAFHELSPMADSTTDRLCRLALIELLPAVAEGRWPEAGAALSEFSRIVGGYFAPVQGGAVAHPRMRSLADALRSRGIPGVGQTSWGPALFALAESEAMGADVADDLRRDPLCIDCDVRIAKPLNRGRVLTEFDLCEIRGAP